MRLRCLWLGGPSVRENAIQTRAERGFLVPNSIAAGVTASGMPPMMEIVAHDGQPMDTSSI